MRGFRNFLVLSATAGVVTAGTLLAGAGPVAAARPATASGSCYFYDNLNNMPGACADETTNFSESGVGVWNDPYHPTTVLAVASSGQAFFTYDPWVSDGTRVTCDNGSARPTGTRARRPGYRGAGCRTAT